MQLIAGKRYMWPAKPQVHGTRWVNGLFTGEYDSVNGNAILMTANGERWSVPTEEIIHMPKKGQ